MISVPDICAYTNKVIAKSGSGVNAATLINDIRSTLIEAGWTMDSATEFISQQCPWFPDDVAPDYFKGRVRIKLSEISGSVYIQVGNYDFSVSSTLANAQVLDTLQNNPFLVGNHLLIAGPYQLAIILPDSQRVGYTKDGCLISSLQVPEFVQSKLGVIDAIIGIPINRARMLHLYTPNNYFLHFNSNETGSFYRDTEVSQMNSTALGCFNILNYNVAGKDVYPIGDPIISPPFVCWGIDSSDSIATINGFLWDIIVLNQYQLGDLYLFFDNHSWLTFTHSSYNGTLLFVTGGTD
jgi:hypothetical protein